MPSIQACPATHTDSNWSDLPADILERVFWLQKDSLDNCAARCTCRAWRRVGSTARQRSMLLYACCDTDVQRYTTFLRSCSQVGAIHLVCGGHWPCSIGDSWLLSPQSQFTPCHVKALLAAIPAACKSLALSELVLSAKPLLHDSLLHLTQLQHLSLKVPRQDQAMWPRIARFLRSSGLQTLDLQFVAIPSGVLDAATLPPSLRRLSCKMVGSRGVSFPVRLPACSQLQQLTCLHFVRMELSRMLPGAAEALFPRLVELSLAGSTLYNEHPLQFSTWTTMQSLDLQGTHLRHFDPLRGNDVWSLARQVFAPPPNLTYLNVEGCLAMEDTLLRLPAPLQHLHLCSRSRLAPEVAQTHPDLQLHLKDDFAAPGLQGSVSDWAPFAQHLAALQVCVFESIGAAAISAFMRLPSLRELRVTMTGFHVGVSLHLQAEQAQLEVLAISGCSFVSIDLETVASLQDVRLTHIGAVNSAAVKLPANLRRLDLAGLYDRRSLLCLQRLRRLQVLTLRTCALVALPALPPSLERLDVRECRDMCHFDMLLRATNLAELIITGTPDESLKALAARLPRLQRLLSAPEQALSPDAVLMPGLRGSHVWAPLEDFPLPN